MNNLQFLKNQLFPYQVEEQFDVYIITAGSPEKQFFIQVTEAFMNTILDKDDAVKMIKRQMKHKVEEDMFGSRYSKIIDGYTRMETDTGEVVMMDTMMPTNHRLLVVHPEELRQLMLLDKIKHVTGRMTAWSKDRSTINWKKELEEKND